MNKHMNKHIWDESFQCQMCGHCCTGRGGIIVSSFDLQRVATGLQMEPAVFLTDYCEKRNDKWCIKVADNNQCLFFKQDIGCSIHTIKPNVCRAWPFFRGNLVDSVSFELAQDYCPGIVRNKSHASFVEAGFAYMEYFDLFVTDLTNGGGNALLHPDFSPKK